MFGKKNTGGVVSGKKKTGNPQPPKPSADSPEISRSTNANTQVLNRIHDVHKKINADHKSDKRDIMSALEELESAIQSLTDKLCEHHNQEPTPSKSTSDLTVAVKNAQTEIRKLNTSLLTSRKDLTDTLDSLAKALNISFDDNHHEHNLSEVNKPRQQVSTKNDRPKLPNKTVATLEARGKKIGQDKSVDGRLSNKESNIAAVLQTIKEMQELNDKLISFARRTICLTGAVDDLQNVQIMPGLEKTLDVLEKDLKSYKKMSDTKEELEEQIKELSNLLNSLSMGTEATPAQRFEDKNKTTSQQEQLLPNRRLEEKHGKDQTSLKGKKKEQNNVENNQRHGVESTVSPIRKAIDTIKELHDQYRTLQYIHYEVFHFTQNLGEINLESVESEMKNTGNKGKNVKNETEVHTNQNTSRQKMKEEKTIHADEHDKKYLKEDFQRSLRHLQYIYNKMKKEIEEKERLLKHISDEMKAAIETSDERRGESLKSDVSDLEDNNDEMIRFDRSLAEIMKTINDKHKNRIAMLKRELEECQQLNSELHTRLSKVAGSKLTDNNPNITNLGDPNRPMKIGENFSELYDNEWTDAMDLCQKGLGSKVNEDNILENLYKTLMSCYKICEEKSDIWIKTARGKFEDFSKVLVIEAQEEVLKQIIDSRKLSADETSKRLLMEVRSPKDVIAKKHLKSIDEKYHKMLIPSPFFTKCFTLCWKMVVQTPQMILQEGPSAGKEFDRNVFREYTSSGSTVVFTVWPALYLHKGGPLLTKGVVKVR